MQVRGSFRKHSLKTKKVTVQLTCDSPTNYEMGLLDACGWTLEGGPELKGELATGNIVLEQVRL